MTVTPYTDPQIDPTVAQPWPSQVNMALKLHDQAISSLHGLYVTIADQQTQIADLKAIIVAILPVVSRHTEQIADANAYAADLDRRLQQLVTSHKSLVTSHRY